MVKLAISAVTDVPEGRDTAIVLAVSLIVTVTDWFANENAVMALMLKRALIGCVQPKTMPQISNAKNGVGTLILLIYG